MIDGSGISVVWVVGEFGVDYDTIVFARSIPIPSLSPSAAAGINWIGSITGGCNGWSAGRFLHASILLCCILINLS